MLFGIFILLLLAATSAGLALWLTSRRAPGAAPVSRWPVPPVEVVLEPADLRQQLSMPARSARAAAKRLDASQVLSKLRGLALGTGAVGPASSPEDAIVGAAIAAIGQAATDGQYAPRRPNLLPQLMRAANDDEISRRELAAIIARDPSLVGSLLKMANSSYYRVSARPVESIDRAIVLLGSEGIRSLIAAAVMQPIFRMSNAQFPHFPEIVWEHALLSASAAVAHAVTVEKADPFAAELLTLVTGLAEIVLFRAALDHYEARPRRHQSMPLAGTIASLLDSQCSRVARHIGQSWELSERSLTALEDQAASAGPQTPLGRSLRFGRLTGGLAVLQLKQLVDPATARASLPEAGMQPDQIERMWSRLTHEPPPPKTRANKTGRVLTGMRGRDAFEDRRANAHPGSGVR